MIQGHRHTAASPETFFGIPMREKEKNTCMYHMWHINIYACIYYTCVYNRHMQHTENKLTKMFTVEFFE